MENRKEKRFINNKDEKKLTCNNYFISPNRLISGDNDVLFLYHFSRDKDNSGEHKYNNEQKRNEHRAPHGKMATRSTGFNMNSWNDRNRTNLLNNIFFETFFLTSDRRNFFCTRDGFFCDSFNHFWLGNF